MAIVPIGKKIISIVTPAIGSPFISVASFLQHVMQLFQLNENANSRGGRGGLGGSATPPQSASVHSTARKFNNTEDVMHTQQNDDIPSSNALSPVIVRLWRMS